MCCMLQYCLVRFSCMNSKFFGHLFCPYLGQEHQARTADDSFCGIRHANLVSSGTNAKRQNQTIRQKPSRIKKTRNIKRRKIKRNAPVRRHRRRRHRRHHRHRVEATTAKQRKKTSTRWLNMVLFPYRSVSAL